jgi:hypothetical protein
MRLNVHVLRSEQRLGTRDREVLGDVDELTSTVVALAGIALRVLVRERGAQRGEHRG